MWLVHHQYLLARAPARTREAGPGLVILVVGHRSAAAVQETRKWSVG
jgi:hypothetical protein